MWTQRTHTLQDSWRPVPGARLAATFGAGSGGVRAARAEPLPRGYGASPYAGGASPVEALQSQVALQEKLRKVRSTFADIRRHVGYD